MGGIKGALTMQTNNNRQREFLSQAAECERSASETLDPIAAQSYRDMARQWRDLAKSAEKAGGG